MLKSRKFLASVFFLLLCIGLSSYMLLPKFFDRSKAAAASSDIKPVTAVGEQDIEKLEKTKILSEKTQTTAENPQSSKPKIVTYTVKTGDTLSSIAGTYGVNVSTISASSGISENSIIRAGQQLRFPSVDGVIHKVSSGENLWDIASVYGVDMDSIVNANGINPAGNLKISQELIIPGANAVKDVLAQSKPSTQASAPRTSSAKTVASSRGSVSGIIWPLRGVITSVFGPRWGTVHKGIDIAAPTGTNVVAAMSGTVIYSGWESGYGNLVVIEAPNGLQTYYGHNSELIVESGQTVSRGQLISKVGSTGNATGPHLHFEIRKGGVPQNPMGYLK